MVSTDTVSAYVAEVSAELNKSGVSANGLEIAVGPAQFSQIFIC